MKKPLHLIYITGLGDAKATAQKRAVSLWRVWGVEPHFFQVKWADGEAWPAKHKRLLKLIDKLKAQGNDVALVAVSAGATAAINAFAARSNELIGVVLIAGKANRPEAIGAQFSSRNPALKPAAHAAKKALSGISDGQRQRILSRFALMDEIVKREDSYIPGARNQRVWMVGHLFTIATQITYGVPTFVRFLRRLQATG